jgi:uncharacterized protein
VRISVQGNLSAVVVHGAGGHPERNWFQWLKQELSSRGIETKIPQFPLPEQQSLESWRETFFSEIGPISPGFVLFGHSVGAALLLNLLDEADCPAQATFLVSGFVGKIGHPVFDPLNESFFKREFNWDRVRSNAGSLFIYSGDNDPYVPIEKGLELANYLRTDLTVIPNGGHLNQESGFTTFPKILEDFDLMFSRLESSRAILSKPADFK